MSLKKDTMTSILATGITTVIGMVQSIILAHYLLPAGRGALAMVMFLPMMIATLSPMGLQWAIIYFLRTEKEDSQKIISTGMTLLLLINTVSFVLTLLMSLFFYQRFLGTLPRVAIILSSCMVFSPILDNLSRGIFRGTDRIVHANVFRITRALVIILSIVVFIFAFHPNVLFLATVILFAQLSVSFGGIVAALKKFKMALGIDLAIAKKMVSYGIRMFAFSVLLYLNFRMDIGILRYFCTDKDVGYYVVGVSLAEVLMNVPNVISFVLFPHVSGSSSQHQNRITTRMCRITVTLVGAGCIVLAAVAWPAVRILYGKAFLPAVVPLIILLPGLLAMSVQRTLGADLSGRGFPERVTKAAFYGVILNFLLNVLLVPRYGIIGSAIASTISYTVIGSLVARAFVEVSKVNLFEVLFPRKDDFLDIKHILVSVRQKFR